jgi:hypothetical protein
VPNEGCEDEDHEGDEYSLGEVMELVKYLSAKLERLESEESAEDFLVLEADVLDSPTDDDSVEVFIAVEALHSLLMCLLSQDLMIIHMRSSKAPHHSLLTKGASSLYTTATNQILRWICWDLQEQTAESYPLFTNEEYYEEINHPEPVENTEKQTQEKSFPTGPVYDDDESDPWESHEGEPEE